MKNEERENNYANEEAQANLLQVHRAQVQRLEDRFGLDLSRSKLTSLEHISLVRRLGHQVVDWLAEKDYKPIDEVGDLHEQVEQHLVLYPEDRRLLLLSHADEGIGYMQTVWERGLHEASPQEIEHARPMYENYVHHLEKDKEELADSSTMPAATKLTIRFGDELQSVCLFSDWSNDFDPYVGRSSLEGAIAEETMHLAARVSQLTVGNKYSEGNVQITHTLEEFAVEYYVSQFLRVAQVPQSSIDTYESYNPTCIPTWRGVIGKIGEKQASNIFFKGQVNARDYRRVKKLIF